MLGKTFKAKALVLSVKTFWEADKLITVFSKSYGKLSLLAKGAQRPTSRKRGSLAVFNHIKFSAVRGNTFNIITEVELLESYPLIKSNLKNSSVAYFLLEVVSKLTREEEVHQDIYEILLENLKDLETSTDTKTLRQNFIYQVLIALGFWPKGKLMHNHDLILESVAERKLFSRRVGKKVLS